MGASERHYLEFMREIQHLPVVTAVDTTYVVFVFIVTGITFHKTFIASSTLISFTSGISPRFLAT